MLYNDLIKIRNAYLAKHKDVVLPYSRLTHNVVNVLSERKYVGDIKFVTLLKENVKNKKNNDEQKTKDDSPNVSKKESVKRDVRELHIELLYTQGVSHLNELLFLSKPGRRLYSRASQLKNVRQGYGDVIVSTSQGIMTARQAREKRLGGEIICEVF